MPSSAGSVICVAPDRPSLATMMLVPEPTSAAKAIRVLSGDHDRLLGWNSDSSRTLSVIPSARTSRSCPAASATMRLHGPLSAGRCQKARCSPSLDQVGLTDCPSATMTVRCVPSARATTMPSAVSTAIRPARVSPNGGAGRGAPTMPRISGTTTTSAASTSTRTRPRAATRRPAACRQNQRSGICQAGRRGVTSTSLLDRLKQPGWRRGRQLRAEPGGDLSLEVVSRGHAIRSPSIVTTRASASSVARIVCRLRCSFDLTVPSGRPRTSAISGSEKPCA